MVASTFSAETPAIAGSQPEAVRLVGGSRLGVACEKGHLPAELELECPEGQVLRVVAANYGRSSDQDPGCGWTGWQADWTGECSATNSLEIMQERLFLIL